MVKKLIFRKFLPYYGETNIIKEVNYHYNWPEDWEYLMDPEDVVKWAKLDGYKIDFISYTPETQTLNYFCKEVVHDNRNN